jgi:hypothetical protein
MNELLVTFISVTLLILLLASGIILSFIISSRQRLQHQLVLSNTQLKYEQELRQVEHEVSEQIRTEIGRELHDNIGQLLTALHFQIESIKVADLNLSANFKQIDFYVSEAHQQLRMLSRTMNNDYLANIGLFDSIQTEIDRLRLLRKIAIFWTKPNGPSNLDKNQELMVFRIFQEIVSNTLRHSEASHLDIRIVTSNDSFSISVKDDGKGFDVKSTLESAKISGLRNIQRRAQLAGFDCKIESEVGKGSLFVLKKNATLN